METLWFCTQRAGVQALAGMKTKVTVLSWWKTLNSYSACGICLLIIYFKFQFSKSMKPSTFHIFLNLTYPLGKSLSQNAPKIHTKPTAVNEINKDLVSLATWPSYWQKGRVRDVKTAFTSTPALKGTSTPTKESL